jgi:hypothetical protein
LTWLVELQEENSTTSQVYYAACLLLVAHSEELRAAVAKDSTARSKGPSLRDIVTGYGTTCFEVFQNSTRMLQSAAGQGWLQDLYDDQETFSKSVKEVISKFLILTITFKKLEKVGSGFIVDWVVVLSLALTVAPCSCTTSTASSPAKTRPRS